MIQALFCALNDQVLVYEALIVVGHILELKLIQVVLLVVLNPLQRYLHILGC